MRQENEGEASSSVPRYQNPAMPGAMPGDSPAKHEHEPDTFHAESTAEEGGVIDAARDLSKVMHLASRPVPTETGDGTYITHGDQGGSLWADLRTLGIEDASTIKDLIENMASGREIDDKTMLMERIIRVIMRPFFFFRMLVCTGL